MTSNNVEAATRGVLWKKELLESSQNSEENNCARAQACNFIKKEALAQVFSCEFCDTSNNTFFREQLWTTASDEDAIIEISIDSVNLIPLTCLTSIDITITPMHSIILKTGKYLTNKWHSLVQRCKTTVIWKTDTTVYIYL